MDSNVTQNDGSDLAQLFVVATAGIGVSVQQMKRFKKLIDELPNECLVIILKKLTWRQLIQLRLVCKRWHGMVHSMGKLQKSLMLTCRRDGAVAFVQLKNRFFVGLNEHNFVVLKQLQFYTDASDTLKYLKTLLGELFPSVEQLLIDFNVLNFPFDDILTLWPAQQITTLSLEFGCISAELPSLAGHLNSFTSLKQLGFGGNFSQILPMITPTLARLEQIAWNVRDGEFSQLFQNLAPNCTRLLFKDFDYAINNFGQLHTFNWQIFAQLTHLNLKMTKLRFVDQVLRLICEESTCLQVLCIMCSTSSSDCCGCADLTTPTVMMLSQLVHLIKLELFNVRLEFNSLEQTSRDGRLVPLSTVKECTLSIGRFDLAAFWVRNPAVVNEDSFTRVLAVFLPNVVSLHIGLEDYFPCHSWEWMNIEKYWNRFPKLMEGKFSQPYLYTSYCWDY